MQPLDYTSFIDGQRIDDILPPSASLVHDIYQRGDGVQFRSQEEHRELIQDVVRVADGVFLLASHYSPGHPLLHSQIVNGSDWVHIQFRMSGSGSERLSQTDVIETPAKSCIISRYPKNSMIERGVDTTNRWKAVCLLATPAGLTAILDLPAPDLPASTRWLAFTGSLEPRTLIVPLQTAMVLAANDILTCAFRGAVRRAYMRAKSLELLSTVIHALDATRTEPARSGIKLSATDLKKLDVARGLMEGDLESTLTLAQMAQRVGLNRTKLALGFKEVFGTSLQAYWRDARLVRARALLSQGRARVTEVALDMGYSELSSFTRAFTRKFGVLPRDCRGGTCDDDCPEALPASIKND